MRMLIKISTLFLIISCFLPFYTKNSVSFAAESSPVFTIAGEHPALSPDGNTVFVGKGRPDLNNDNHYLVGMYDVKTGALLKEIPSNNASDYYDYSPNGKYLVSSGTYTNFLDGKTGDPLFTLPYYFPRIAFQQTNDDIIALTFSSSGNVLLDGDTLVIYDLATKQILFEKTYENLQTMKVAMHPTQPIVAVSRGLDIEIINYETGQTLQTITNPFQMPADQQYWAIKYMQYSPDGKTLSAINMYRGVVPFKQFDVNNNYQEVTPINVFANETSTDNMPINMSYSPDGSEVYFYYTGKMKAFDVNTGNFKWEINGDLNSIVFSSDMKKIAYTRNDSTNIGYQPKYVAVKDFPFTEASGKRIEFAEPFISLRQGNSTYYGVQYFDENNQRTLLDPSQVTLEPLNPDIIGVDSSNKIIAKQPGSTFLKASYNGLVAYLNIEVQNSATSKIILDHPLYDSSMEITGKAVPNVTLDANIYNRYYQVQTNTDGSFKIQLDKPLMADTFVVLSYPIFGGADYLQEYVIRDTVAPSAPKVTTVNDQTGTMEGVTEPNATITVTNDIPPMSLSVAGTTSGMKALSVNTVSIQAGKDGKFKVSLPFGTLAGKRLSTTATDLAGNRSKQTITSVPIKTGWVKSNNHWYFYKSNGAMATGWLKYNNHWYYLNSSGVMLTGWVKLSGKWYYLAGSGMMLTGWVKYGNDWYYLDKITGVMKTGWVKDAGKWYYFYSSGKMAHDTKVGKYRLGHNGAMM